MDPNPFRPPSLPDGPVVVVLQAGDDEMSGGVVLKMADQWSLKSAFPDVIQVLL